MKDRVLECQSWNESVQNTAKLRTYSLFKEQFKADDYVYLRCRKFRSMMSQLRLGILPLEIETGRWKSIEVENRLCKLCSQNRVEDEYHFLFDCEVYSDDRVNFFIEISISYHEFMALSVKDRWKYIMSEPNAVKTAKFIYTLFEREDLCCSLSDVIYVYNVCVVLVYLLIVIFKRCVLLISSFVLLFSLFYES